MRSSNHQARNCTSSLCRTCRKTHNTLLHFESSTVDSTKGDNRIATTLCNPASASSANPSSPVVTQCSQINNITKIFLSTVIIDVYDNKGQLHGCRALLDSGSQLNFVTEDFVNKLHIDTHPLHISISAVAEGTFESRKKANISFRSRVNAYTNNVECVILPKITQKLPQEFCPISEFKIPPNITLADPHFNIPNEIDLLIGAQLFWQLICVGQIRESKAHPTLQKTKFGWVISGMSHKFANRKVTAACHLSQQLTN